MTNHPNRQPVYRVSLLNGRYDHVVTKRGAVLRAIELTGADVGTNAKTLERDWGVRIERVSRETARAVGL